MIELADKWTRQPQGVRRIDCSHPLARGLTAAFEAQAGKFVDVLNTPQSATVDTQSLRPNAAGTALVGDGTNYLRYANNNARYGSVPPFTLAAYLVRRGTLTQYRRVVENGALRSPNTSGWDIDVDASNGLVFIGWPATNISTTTGPLPLDTPTLLVWSVNAAGITTYVNGVQSSSNAAANYFSATDGAFSLLRILSDEHSPTANIDIVSARIWASRALSAADVKALHSNYWQIYAKRPKRVFVTAGGGGSDVTVALSGQAATASAGTLVPSSSKALSGQAATISAGTLTPTYSRALTGTAVTTSAGTLTPSLAKALSGTAVTVSAGILTSSTTVALSGQSVAISAGTITYSAGSDISLALTGAEVTASAGTLVPSSSVSLAGSAVTASAGTVVPTFPRTLSGSAVTVSAGSVTPSTSVPLSGQAVTVSAGTLTYAPQGDVTVALTGEAVTVSAGTLTASGGDADLPFYGYGNLGPSVRKKKKRPAGPRPKTLREQLEETYEQLVAKSPVPPAAASSADSSVAKPEAKVQLAPAPAPAPVPTGKPSAVADEPQERQDVAADVREALQAANQPILEWLAHINQNVTELHEKLDRMEEQRKQARRKAQHDLLLG